MTKRWESRRVKLIGALAVICLFLPALPIAYLTEHYDWIAGLVCAVACVLAQSYGTLVQGRFWLSIRERERRAAWIQYEIEAERERLEGKHFNVCELNESAFAKEDPISGAIFERLQRAVATFPTRYPDYSTKPPKLDDDIRPWLKEYFGASEREAHVFGAIIAEHFQL